MASFTGTSADEIITPNFVSPTVTASGGTAPSNAADVINAGGGNDIIDSGGGNDVVTGGPGNDVALLGAGNDTFIWNPGDGSDTVEGQSGFDTLQFNGANIGENIDISANGSRVRFFRDVANITMDLDGVEQINFKALGGADHIVVNDLSGTAAKQVAIDLSATGGGGDGQADTVTVNATTGDDHISVASDGTSVKVSGLSAQVTITGAEPDRDSLIINGQAGVDTVQLNGTNGADTIGVLTNGQSVEVTGIGNIVVDVNNAENVVISAGAGDDTINAAGLASGLTQLTIDGGAGNDTIIGSQGADVLKGGDGNDLVVGGRGNDTAFLGSGDDTFVWNPGDGSDTVEGQAGFDTLQFNGANIAENIDISANGSRVTFFRNVGNVTMDLNGIEQIKFNALGGADNIVVNDLSGTDVKQVAIDLSATGGGGDGQPDTVTVNGTAGKDHITVAGDGAAVIVDGLPAQVTITGAEPANDSLVVKGGDGNDSIDASGFNAGQINLVLDGGNGNDTLVGSRGADMLIGGAGDDVVTGGSGNDVALLGDGNDVFVWNPGDGSDTVEGQAGTDTLAFNGSNLAENISVSANGPRATVFRDVGNVVMDLNGIEHVQIQAGGGADTLVVNDMTGTDVTQVAIDLAAAGGHGGDGQPDQVVVNATAGNDFITIDRSGGTISVGGLAATVTITHADATLDHLTVSGGGGDDVIDASSLQANQIGLTLNGGDGNDVILGSRGDDVVVGGRGNDVAFLGSGDDTFIWNPGDGSDTVDGQAGTDTLLFNGSNAGENVAISANGSHVLFTRDVAAITMNLNAIEHIEFNALGGADHVVVNDLSGTGVKEVDIDLSATGGGGDGQPDTVTVNGTAGKDHITVTSSGASIVVNGLPAQVAITGAEPGNDSLIINGGAGNDTIDASGLPAGTMSMTLAGGAGNDTLVGGGENDTFLFTSGEGGHDVIQGFQAHGASLQGDIVALAGFADRSFDQLVANSHIVQSGADVVVSDGTSVVATLQHVVLASLHANDFAFS